MIPLTRRTASCLVLAVLLLAGPNADAQPTTGSGKSPRNLILLIPDGCGPAEITLARVVTGRPLALDPIEVGTCVTAAADALVTDSAAASTAYACGVSTRNRIIGLDPRLLPVGTILEAAQTRGMRVGLVSTSRITHATPAAFAAHVPDRDQEAEIALQYLEHRIDVVLGGGRREFLPRAQGGTRGDRRDLLLESRAAGVTVIGTRAELLAPLRPPVLGLFTADHMSYDVDRDPTAEPSLAEMTRRALDLLAREGAASS